MNSRRRLKEQETTFEYSMSRRVRYNGWCDSFRPKKKLITKVKCPECGVVVDWPHLPTNADYRCERCKSGISK